jgi:hypothetical protein
MKKDARPFPNRPFLFSFILTSTLFTLILFFFTPFFRVNDDSWQVFISKGVGLTTEPNEHIFLGNVLYGFLLKFFYTFFPRVSWYGYFQILTLFLAFWAFLAGALLRSRSKFTLLIFLIGFCFIGLNFILQPSYTTVCIIAFQCGIFLLANLLSEQSRSSRNKIIFLGALCLFLSSLIRLKAFFFSSLFTIPFIAYTLWSGRERLKNLTIAVFILLPILGCALFDHFYYARDPGWKEFTRFHETAVKYLDCRNMVYNDRTKPFFDAGGWSYNDLNLFRGWYFLDEEKFGPDNLEKIGSKFPAVGSEGKPGSYSSLWHTLSTPTSINMLLCFFLFLLFTPARKFYFILANTVWVLLTILYMLYFAKAPDWLFLPAFFFLVNLSIFFAVPPKSKSSPKDKPISKITPKTGYISLFLLALLLTPTIWNHYRTNHSLKINQDLLKQTLARLNPQDNQLFVVWDSVFPYELISSLDNFEVFRHFRIFALAPFERSPIAKKMLTGFEIKELFRDMVDRPDVFIICSAHEGAMYQQYMRERYGMEVYAERTFESPFFSAYRILSKPPSRPPKK